MAAWSIVVIQAWLTEVIQVCNLAAISHRDKDMDNQVATILTNNKGTTLQTKRVGAEAMAEEEAASDKK